MGRSSEANIQRQPVSGEATFTMMNETNGAAMLPTTMAS